MKRFLLPTAFLFVGAPLALAVTPIPEPGAVFYGRLTLSGSNAAQNITSLSWSVTEPGTGRIVEISVGNGIEIITHNSEAWFVARFPFVTTAVDGFSFDPPPSNAFPLSATPVAYNRSAIVANGQAVTIKSPGTTSFTLPEGPAQTSSKALTERLDLVIVSANQALYDSWIATYYPSGDPRALADADPDADGIKNLMERALGLDPSKFSAVPVSSGKTLVGDEEYFTFTYTRREGVQDAIVIPQISTGLIGWSSGPTSLVEVSNVVQGDFRVITVRDTLPMDERTNTFIRLSAQEVRP